MSTDIIFRKMVKRRLTYKLYPSPAQAAAMERHRALHRQLYNAALEERIGAWRRGVSINLGQQEKSLRLFKNEGEWRAVHTHAAQVTLKRLDLAMQAFFRRVKAGETPGFPRFKSHDRYPGWGYKEHGNGFRFEPGENWRNGRLRISGVGEMPARGLARTPGRILTCDIVLKADGWHASIAVETDCTERRKARGGVCGLDWGVETFATVASGDPAAPRIEAFPNLRHLADETEALKAEQRAWSKTMRETPKAARTKRLERERRRLARRWRKVANRRKDHAHKLSARLAGDFSLIVTEDLSIRNMTKSAKGDAEAPGRNIAQKAGLNRAILDTAPAAFLTMLGYKAEEAGAGLILVNPRRHKPSQTCPACGRVEKKLLSQRVHACACGLEMGRDAASATYMLDFGLRYRWDPASARHYKAGNPAKAETSRRNRFAARGAAGAERPCAPVLAAPGVACASG